MLDTFSGIGGFSLAAEWTGRISPVQLAAEVGADGSKFALGNHAGSIPHGG